MRDQPAAEFSGCPTQGTLFGYFEYHGDDFAADMARIADDAETQRWWKLTDPCQESWPDAGSAENG